MTLFPKKDGVKFDCANCPMRIQKLRRCREKRWDFDATDNAMWPMAVHKGGPMFGFCPGKATWDLQASSILRLLILAAETGVMYHDGGLSEQPQWWVELLSWFIPRYNDRKFIMRVESIVGDGSKEAPVRQPKR